MTICNDEFFKFAKFSVKKILKFYPNSKIYLYDWGLSSYSKQKFREIGSNIEIIDWTQKIDWENGYKTIKYAENVPFKKPKREYLWNQKPLCILDCVGRINENLIYIDADAFLIKKLNGLFKTKFDIGVTAIINKEILKKKEDIVMDSHINAGVLFFLADSEKVKLFIKEWIKEINKTHCYLAEQTALIKIIERDNVTILDEYFNEGIVNISGNQFKVKILPYYIYNYHEIEHLYDYTEAKIVHIFYRGVRKLPQLICEYRLNYFFLKFLRIIPKRIHNKFNYIQNLNIIASFLVQPGKIQKILIFFDKYKIDLLQKLKTIHRLFLTK